ncbi:hypothetical protein IHE55_01975 [Streptomyces pactum]|uniref:Lipoprotein n=1 Tax=Streptomyces pactum TaxID=68249 RepID=A0ABS0NEK4_9ACTN|nr:hypothetical protein [Streptomyces pactum]MBH5333638.1 hypothetical protein [Streptomyces pactum]
MRGWMAWAVAVAVGAAVLTGCDSSSDDSPGTAGPSESGRPATGGEAQRKPTSSELDFTWFPDGGGVHSLGIRHGEALMPTVNQCDGTVTFGAEVVISFPCGTERARGTMLVNPSGDKLTISWGGGVTDTFVKRPDLTVPDPTLTGVPDLEDLDRQLKELEDLVGSTSGLGG